MQKDFSKNIFSELPEKDQPDYREEFGKSCRHYVDFPSVLLEKFIDTKELLQFYVGILFCLANPITC